MSLPIPLGVRVHSFAYDDFSLSYENWITKYVTGLTFRSTIPGGFSDATITLETDNAGNAPDYVAVSATVTGGTTSTVTMLDAAAVNVSVGDRPHFYTSGGVIRFNGTRFLITSKSSVGGTTTIQFSPAASAAVVSGDTMRIVRPSHFYDAGSISGFSKLVRLYNRIQVFDLRSMEIVWEGRIEDPARQIGSNTWQIGCQGSSIVASDIKRPIFYLDADLSSWSASTNNSTIEKSSDESSSTLTAEFRLGFSWGSAFSATNPAVDVCFGNFRIGECHMETMAYTGNEMGIGRIDVILDAVDLSPNQGRFGSSMTVVNQNGSSQSGVAKFLCNATGPYHLNRLVGTHFNIGGREVNLEAGNWSLSTSGNDTGSSGVSCSWRLPRIQPMRMTRFGIPLNTAASYPHGGVKLPEIIEDVIGRFLVHDQGTGYRGSVRPQDAYIDTTQTDLLVYGLSWLDGATAADIFNQMVTDVQPNAYWAIWESRVSPTMSKFPTGQQQDTNSYMPYRFEWATWPSSWGYQFTSQDGLTEQPNGDNLYNFVFYKYQKFENRAVDDAYFDNEVWWGTGEGDRSQELSNGVVLRSNAVTRGSPIDFVSGDHPSATDEAIQWLADNSHTTNSGSVTIKRPVALYDPAVNSWSGAGRSVDPWNIRPGKLCRIIDIPPRARIDEFTMGFGGGIRKPHNPVRVATTANMTLSGATVSANGIPAGTETKTVDGVTIFAGDRILVKDQTTATANGIYVVQTGSWTRATDANETGELVQGSIVNVARGTANGGRTYRLNTANPITIGSTNQSWVEQPTAPSRLLDDTIFRCVTTEYNVEDNACKIDLDQVATWDVANQVVAPAKKPVKKQF